MGLPVLVTLGFDCDDVQLGREITLLSAQMNVASYRLLKLIAECCQVVLHVDVNTLREQRSGVL